MRRATILLFTAAALASCQRADTPDEQPPADMSGVDDGAAPLEDIGVADMAREPDLAQSDIEDMAPAADMADMAVADLGRDMAPEPPAALTRYLTGEAADAAVTPDGPGFILMGGGPDVDAAFAWWRPRIAGGDVVVLRASGEDGYNPYLYTDIGGADSVETLLVTSRELADDPYVARQVERAEGIFIAGGDQARYLELWGQTALSDALARAHQRGAIIGGTSAGCAILGQFVFSAERGTIYSDEALVDPYDDHLTLARDFVAFEVLGGVITDTHFYERDRMGRLVTFLARLRQDGLSDSPLGLGIDEATALVIDASGQATVLGEGYVYAVEAEPAPSMCRAGAPLEYADVPYARLGDGDTFSLPGREGLVLDRALGASGGELIGEDIY